MKRWTQFWTWFVMRFWVTRHEVVTVKPEYAVWPVFVHGMFAGHHKTRRIW